MIGQQYIGVDIGGTSTKIGLVDGQRELLDHSSIPTGPGRKPESLVDDIVTAIDRLTRTPPAAIGVGCPGPLSPSTGIVYNSPNIPGWENVPLRDLICERIGVSTVIGNDANVAALGQYIALPDDQKADLVLLTLGTGIGSGTIIDGQVFSGHHETGSEWGHCIVEIGGRPCPCGQRGCLEQYASASALAKIATERIGQGESSSLAGNVSAESIVEAVRNGDALAADIWSTACRYLAIAIINIQHAINPRYVFLGGGVSLSGQILLDNVVGHFQAQRWSAHNDQPTVRLAPLANMAGILGAAALARQHVTDD